MLRGLLPFGCALLCVACASGETAPTPAPVTAAPSAPVASDHEGSSGDPSSAGDPTATSSAPASSGSPASPGSPGSAECQALASMLGEIGCGVVKLWCAAASAVTIGHTKIPCDVAVAFACDLADDAAAAMAALCDGT
jgi:hypothetical protein